MDNNRETTLNWNHQGFYKEYAEKRKNMEKRNTKKDKKKRNKGFPYKSKINRDRRKTKEKVK